MNYTELAINYLWHQNPESSAKILMNKTQKYCALFIVVILLWCLVFSPLSLGISILLIINIIFFANLLFKAFLIFTAKSELPPDPIELENFPKYTILLPVYREGKILSKLIENIAQIEYPKDKLEVMLIIEEDDDETKISLKNIDLPSYFRIIEVPHSLPKTKPKACNYGIWQATGEYVTIYDAEDRPEPKQLKRVLWQFYHNNDKLVCVQARLNYYNRSKNILTLMFSLEYSLWFNYMLSSLERLNSIIPLGGTSNHFKMSKLKELGFWDPYNVTEDADLGIRLNAKGYRTKVINSYTLEEAPSNLSGWLKQRARWIQGYIQTYLVHMRNPIKLYKNAGFLGFVCLQLFVLLPSLSYIISPIIWIFNLSYLFNQLFFIDLPYFLKWFMLCNLYLGYFLPVLCVLPLIFIGELQVNHRGKFLCAIILFPFYWFLHSLASYLALKQLAINPHYWIKTEHGIDL